MPAALTERYLPAMTTLMTTLMTMTTMVLPMLLMAVDVVHHKQLVFVAVEKRAVA